MVDAPKQYRKTVQHQENVFCCYWEIHGKDILYLYFCWIIYIISANEPSAIPETSERWTDDVYKLYFRKSSFTLKDLVRDVQKVIQSFPNTTGQSYIPCEAQLFLPLESSMVTYAYKAGVKKLTTFNNKS